jgi:hypothetical protein
LVGYALLISACGPSKSEHEQLAQEAESLKKENQALKSELDELKNGTDRLTAQVEKAYQSKDYPAAKLAIKSLAEHHPESPQNARFAQYLLSIESAERAEQAQLAATEKERKRLANLNNTGIWRMQNYVDEFGNDTAIRCVTNKDPIKGTFSNSATQNSPLLVDILIDSKSEVAIRLYEYARNNPVKAIHREGYRVAFQDSRGGKYTCFAFNSSDRLSLDLKNSSDSLYNAFMQGGNVKFRIVKVDQPSTSYSFEIEPEGYENAIRLLLDGNKK